jgi:hypothetical protein
MLATLLIGFWALSGFFTPPSPTESAEQIAQMYAQDHTRIRLGLLLSMLAAALLVPWSTAIAIQARRGEGQWSPLPFVQMLCSIGFSLEFIFPIMVWQAAGYRDELSPEVIRALNDVSWLCFVGLTSTAVLQTFALGTSILLDRHAIPVFPRWAGYLNVFAGIMFMPGSLCVFFKTGPFAYDGIFAWYLPVAFFAIVWMPVNSVLCLQAIARQEREHRSISGVADLARA